MAQATTTARREHARHIVFKSKTLKKNQKSVRRRKRRVYRDAQSCERVRPLAYWLAVEQAMRERKLFNPTLH